MKTLVAAIALLCLSSTVPTTEIAVRPDFRHLKRTLNGWRKEGRTLKEIEGLLTNGGRS